MRALMHFAGLLLGAWVMTGCASPIPPTPFDYTAYAKSAPKSILVLPPLNESPDVKAVNSFYAQTPMPLGEQGYYVFPVTLVDETFKANGLSTSQDIHEVDIQKLHTIFGADAALYITVVKYGTQYFFLDSITMVTAAAKLVDLKTGDVLWSGNATASDSENQNNQGGLVGVLVGAVVKQILSSTFDKSHEIAGITSTRLLGPRGDQGLLIGPRHPEYVKPQAP